MVIGSAISTHDVVAAWNVIHVLVCSLVHKFNKYSLIENVVVSVDMPIIVEVYNILELKVLTSKDEL